MSQIPSIACDLPGCQTPGEQTPLSIGLRITALVLGLIATTLGVLSVLNIPGLNQLGTVGGWGTVGGGLFLGFVAASIKCVQGKSKEKIDLEPLLENSLPGQKNSEKTKRPPIQEPGSRGPRDSYVQVTLPNGKAYHKKSHTPQKILSDFPEIVREHLGSAPHFIIDESITFKDIQPEITTPLAVISIPQGVKAFYLELYVAQELCLNSETDSPKKHSPFSFFMNVVIWKRYKNDDSWVLSTIDEDPSVKGILGDQYFFSGKDMEDNTVWNTEKASFEDLLEIEEYHKLPDGYERCLAWVLQRLFKKEFFKISVDLGYQTYRQHDPTHGYWCISLAKSQTF